MDDCTDRSGSGAHRADCRVVFPRKESAEKAGPAAGDAGGQQADRLYAHH